jgi:hypothetical protein
LRSGNYLLGLKPHQQFLAVLIQPRIELIQVILRETIGIQIPVSVLRLPIVIVDTVFGCESAIPYRINPDAISERNNARRSYLSAMSTYWSLYYTLRSMTGYDFYTNTKLSEQLPTE